MSEQYFKPDSFCCRYSIPVHCVKEMEETDAANSSKTKEQEKQDNRFENHENFQEY
jgi:hypothetical protein